MKKILILGHNGLLGNMVYKYFKSTLKYKIYTTNFKWNDDSFKQKIINLSPDYIINCIGIIPQKNKAEELYTKVNYLLPVWLDTLNIKIIHPDTDESDSTPYGLSKRLAREHIGSNTKIIKTSIIGFEKKSKVSFLEWFLNSKGTINGYTNNYWNGNTTLEWSHWAEIIIDDWSDYNKITTIANPECKSKYEILMMLKGLFQKDINIIPVEGPIKKENCLKPDYYTNDLLNQLIEMRYFYKK